MSRHGTLTTVFLIVVGVGLSVAGTVFLHQHVTGKALIEFESDVEEGARSLKRELDRNLEVLFSVKALYEATGAVDRDRFGTFAAQALRRHPGIRALEWVPRVPAAERPGFEDAARREGFRDFSIREQSEHGRMIPAGTRDEYFPVDFIEPMEGNEAALGFDLASDATRRRALETSRATGEMRATAGITLVQEPVEKHGMVVFLPVYDGEPRTEGDRISATRGFVAGVFVVGDIFHAAPGIARAEAANVELILRDDSPGESGHVLHRGGAVAPPPYAGIERSAGLDVAGRRWTVVAKPGDQYRTARRSWEPYSVLFLGLLLTGSLVGYVRVSSTRTRAVEKVVDARTQDLREVNERLEQQRNLLQSILDNLGDGVSVTDEDGKLTLFNPAAEQILGLGRLDVGPEEWSETYGLFYPDTLKPAAVEDLPLARAVAGEESGDVELFVRNPERPGGVFIRVNATPLRDGQGKLRGGVAVFRDISERKWAEAVLRDSEARFRAIVEATASALIILSPEHRIREFNPQAEQIFGLGRAQALGQDFLELCLPDEYRAAVAGDVRRALAGERTPGFEVPVPSRGGPERTLLWSFSRLAEGEDSETVVIATGHDITERREAEQARRVRELAAHLQSAREAERTHVAREIHDELGQALTGLKLEVSYLARRAGDGSGAMRERLDGVGSLIDGTIASVRRIAAELRPQILDELGLLEAIRWQVQEFERRTEISCALELPEAELDWSTDRATAMFRILQEALTNVARHAGATRASVQVTRLEDRVVLEVSDDGRGITKEQASDSPTFGLLGMRERARMFGGTLKVESGERRGTTVTVSMPY
jgi:PAS domain S-box-containing protein